MAIYYSEVDAVFGLHKKGYVHDFQLVGDDLLCIQEKQLVRAEDFAIAECHRFNRLKRGKGCIIILGIYDLYRNIKGILIWRYSRERFNVPPQIIRNTTAMISDLNEKKLKLN